MKYVKLIAICIGDFSSTIEFEQNYSTDDKLTYSEKKKELENLGYICVLANVDTNITI